MGFPKHVQPIEFGFLLLGLAGSMLVAWRLAQDDSDKHPLRAFSPWGGVCVVLFLAACG